MAKKTTTASAKKRSRSIRDLVGTGSDKLHEAHGHGTFARTATM